MSNPSFFARCWRPLALIAAVLPTQATAQWAANGESVCEVFGDQTAPAIASDGSNGAIMGWTDARFGALDIYAQRVDAAGTPLWSTGGVAVCTAVNEQSGVAMFTDFAQGAMFFWADFRSPGPGIYTQHLDANGVPLFPLNGFVVSTLNSVNRSVVVISDGGNGLAIPRGYLVAWYGQVGHGDDAIKLQRVNTDGVGHFTSGQAVVSSTQTQKGRLVMASDGKSVMTLTLGAVLAWSEDRSTGTGSDIYVRRVDALGTPQWTSDGIRMCGSAGEQTRPAIANVGTDNCIVAWTDLRTPDQDIYAQRIDSAGTLFWIANGLPVCRAFGVQTNPEVLKDGAGGAFIAWVDGRVGSSQIWAQRIDANGAPLWTLDGLPVCNAATGADSLKLLTDGAGGFYVTWRDTRSDTGNIFVQRTNANGGQLFPTGGISLCAAPSTQMAPQVVGGASGLIAVWQDHRNAGLADIFVNRVSAGGGVTDAPIVAATSSSLSLVSENPTRVGARFRLALPESRNVTMDVCDVTGRRVRSLASGRALGSGTHSLTWDGADDVGSPVAAGVYFVRLAAGDKSETTRVVVVR